jgi:hypothetical protein
MVSKISTYETVLLFMEDTAKKKIDFIWKLNILCKEFKYNTWQEIGNNST